LEKVCGGKKKKKKKRSDTTTIGAGVCGRGQGVPPKHTHTYTTMSAATPTPSRLRGRDSGRAGTVRDAAAGSEADAAALAAIAAGLSPVALTREELARFRGRQADYLGVRCVLLCSWAEGRG
jgi:hypothetical protein